MKKSNNKWNKKKICSNPISNSIDNPSIKIPLFLVSHTSLRKITLRTKNANHQISTLPVHCFQTFLRLILAKGNGNSRVELCPPNVQRCTHIITKYTKKQMTKGVLVSVALTSLISCRCWSMKIE